MKVKNFLEKNPVVISPDCTVLDLCKKWWKSDVLSAAVLENNKLVGFITLHDILANTIPYHVRIDLNLASAVHEGYFQESFQRLKGKKIGEFMNQEIDHLEPDDTAIKAVSIFVECKRRALPVLDEDMNFVGVITRASLLDVMMIGEDECTG